MEPVNRMRVEFTSLPANVAFARVAAAAFASQLDFTLNDLEEIKVAVSEAVTNAIVHGYENSAGGTVVLAVEIRKNTLKIVVEDTGKGIEDMEKALQPAYSTDPERMGLGFAFMQSFSDSLKVESKPNAGTRVTMTKVCARKASSPAGR
ncbi:MAG: anti-sigma F factor [Peptococcaceae bacterium]|nr:anti-sigma F factor [Peptococcaceae bacterium]